MKSTTATLLLLLVFCNINGQNNNTTFVPYQQKIEGSKLAFKMVPIQAGKFTIGSKVTEKNRKADEGPQKEIQVAAFWMSAYEVTRDELDVFLKDESTSQNITDDAITRPSAQYVDLSWGMGKEGGYPANSMSQRTAIMYCRWLYEKTKIFYRLPTEAEWEYAAGGGETNRTRFGNGRNILNPAEANFDASSFYKEDYSNVGSGGWMTVEIGSFIPNQLGLYDMTGNVEEWCWDWWGSYPNVSPDINPKGAFSGTERIVRGGSASRSPKQSRVPFRGKWSPTTDGLQSVGFRVATNF